MEHQFHCLCYSSVLTGGVDSYLGCISLWPSHCSTNTVEQYGGNLLHREKGKCYIMSNLWWVIRSWQYENLCCECFIVHFFTSCMFRYIRSAWHVPGVFVCMESSNVEPLYNGHHGTQLALYREVLLEKCSCILYVHLFMSVLDLNIEYHHAVMYL